MFKRLINWARYQVARLIHWRRRNARIVVVMGGPGAGKGTVCKLIAPDLGIHHLSTGDIFRREIAAQTELGKQVEPYLKESALVPNGITLAALRKELEQPAYYRGVVLDGFPRTLEQAQLLEDLLRGWGNKVERVILLEVPEQDLIDRLSLRRTCSNKSCGRTYHTRLNPPRKADVCDFCGSALYQRPDDVPENISRRLREYRATVRPLCDYYRETGVLTTVESTNEQSPQVVAAVVFSAITGKGAKP